MKNEFLDFQAQDTDESPFWKATIGEKVTIDFEVKKIRHENCYCAIVRMGDKVLKAKSFDYHPHNAFAWCNQMKKILDDFSMFQTVSSVYYITPYNSLYDWLEVLTIDKMEKMMKDLKSFFDNMQ